MATSGRSWDWKLTVGVVMGFAIAYAGDCAIAQIVPDGTLPNNSVVTPQGKTSVISGGTQKGGNLFHSFEQFSIPTGGAAYFNNALNIQNIISRVTGGSVSNIDGLIQANGSANLFLLNPNGIIFGSNASLNIGGSFVGSTARSLNFADGTQFSTTAPQTKPLLTVNVPIGLQFGGNPGSIVNQSQAQSLGGETNSAGDPVGLKVQPGKTLALIGGNVILEGGNLTAAGGRIELGSVAGVGEVSLSQTGNSWVLGYDENNAFGDILLQGVLLVDASGKGGGDVQLQSARLEMTQGANIWADTLGAEAGGKVLVRTTKAIALRDDSQITADVFGSGTGGDLSIETGRLSVSEGAGVSLNTFGEGDAGNLLLQARDTVEVTGAGSLLTANTGATGVGGNLTLETGRLIVRDGGQIGAGTSGSESGGTLEVKARESVELIGESADGQNPSGLFTSVEPGATGNGGNLTVETRRLIVQDGAEIQAGTEGSGSGGTLAIKARDLVELINGSLFTSVQPGATGAGGNLTLKTGRLIVRDGGQIGAGTFSSGAGGTLSVTASDAVEVIGESADGQNCSGLFVSTEGAGNAGDLRVDTGWLLVKDGAAVSASTFNTGAGGTLSVTASDAVEVIGESADGQLGSGLFAQTLGDGDAGDLRIDTGRLLVKDGAAVSASTFDTGAGGTLSVTASGAVELIGTSADGQFSSGLFAQAVEGAGDAGDLRIDTGRLLVKDGAVVSASTFDTGAGGTLSVTASDAVELIGKSTNGQFSSGLFAQTEGVGDAGDLRIDAGRLNAWDGAIVSVRSIGSGNAGNLEVTADSIRLENLGTLIAETASGQGGNITLRSQDLLLLRNNSQISTTAGTAGAGGNGGNITIDTPFVVAVPGENSDITANAFTGNGGNIQITTSGIFGTQFRKDSTPQSDITASSEFGLRGSVEINTPDVDPSRGLVQLSAELIDAPGLIATGCEALGENEFIITGRGGLPPSPSDPLRAEALLADWVTLKEPEDENRSAAAPDTKPASAAPTQIVETTGWLINDKGEVVLTANAPTVTSHIPWLPSADCHAPEPES